MNFFEETQSIYCKNCGGICKGKNPAETQKNANKKFGITPINCVPDCNGKSHCPYAKK